MKRFIAPLLTPVIALTLGATVFAADIKAQEKVAGATAEMKAEPVKVAVKAKLIDINSATEAQLSAIPGVGDEYAKKIIAGRPYQTKGQLNAKKIIPADLYQKINKLMKAVC
jgi:competence protein ComEA